MAGIENFRAASADECEEVKVGDWVRSYDFEHMDDTYALGKVTAIDENMETFGDCNRYTIRVFQSVVQGAGGDRPVNSSRSMIHPPVNGVRNSMGGYCNGVRKLDEEGTAFWQERYEDWASDVEVY